MIIRLIFLVVLAALAAAFFGKRRLASGLLLVAVLAGIALAIYEQAGSHEQNQYFSSDTVEIESIDIKPSGYRPNLYKLEGVATNAHPEIELDGMRLELIVSECPSAGPCAEYGRFQNYVETRLKPGERGAFDTEIYFQEPFPDGELEVEHEVLEYRGRKPAW